MTHTQVQAQLEKLNTLLAEANATVDAMMDKGDFEQAHIAIEIVGKVETMIDDVKMWL